MIFFDVIDVGSNGVDSNIRSLLWVYYTIPFDFSFFGTY